MLQETIAFTLEPQSGWMTAGEKRFEKRFEGQGEREMGEEEDEEAVWRPLEKS